MTKQHAYMQLACLTRYLTVVIILRIWLDCILWWVSVVPGSTNLPRSSRNFSGSKRIQTILDFMIVIYDVTSL